MRKDLSYAKSEIYQYFDKLDILKFLVLNNDEGNII